MTAPPPLGIQRPILVTGMPRSGTTWVARMIHASGLVGYVNEPFNLAKDPGTLRIPVERWFPYITAENEDRVLPPLADLLAFRYPLLGELKQCRSRNDVLHTLKWWRSYVTSRGRRPLVKEPHAVFSAEWFARRLESDLVVTVRHPAAVVSSWKRLGWNFDFEHLLGQPALLRDWLGPFEGEMRAVLEPSIGLVDRVALLWHVVYRVVDEQRRRSPDFQVVRQEDLASDAVARYQRLYEALGLPFTADTAAAVAASSSAGNPKEPRAEEPHQTMLDSKAGLDNWRQRLDPDEVARIRGRTDETAALYYAEREW